MSSEALTALKRSRSQCFRARDVESLRVVLSRAEALQARSPEPSHAPPARIRGRPRDRFV